ncbi:AAA domain-containing protein, putative AbiEii toxin, Type IV TA system [Sphingopyxis sp. YR583]|uniref:AAA family ATPase n=1 Tax=Sphingopyxis sp. YR583 TaxID=1881047 RepID=UPI0008A7707E|nr:AAA family ATPase [Sphingopyxis sp. YR583]SEH12646.1 AAA domain-containing protein, putative AbiEii toxin, Type IV TA system [Sphingopyxis sp. YR583]
MSPRLFVQSGVRRPHGVDADEALILLRDDWNDFGFQTLFDLWYKTGDRVEEIGSVRILRAGQEEGRSPLFDGEQPGGQLGDDYVSLGNNVDYYLRLLDLGIASSVRPALNDLTASPDLRRAFETEKGLRVSLYRSKVRPEEFYDEIDRMFGAGGRPPDDRHFTFSFVPQAGDPPLVFDFDVGTVAAGQGLQRPSRRAMVLVGANGVGKTSLLARIARVAYAPPAERTDVAVDGMILEPVAFPNIVAVSYSPFDSFEPPRLHAETEAEVEQQYSEGRGRYIYLGLRDLSLLGSDGMAAPRLVTQEELADAFAENIMRIRERNRMPLFARSLDPVLREQSFMRYVGVPPIDKEDELTADELSEMRLAGLLGEDPKALFARLSSGHKIILHQLAGLTANLQRHGLALIDEPETHLHPPLLAALMSSIRRLLGRLNAYAIVATHSPVVVQEALAAQVLILSGREPTIAMPPQIETYGENVGALTREVFGYHPTAGDYRDVLDSLVKRSETVEEVEAFLGADLSGQALAHVIAALARKNGQGGGKARD